jgi:hypothetical protein
MFRLEYEDTALRAEGTQREEEKEEKISMAPKFVIWSGRTDHFQPAIHLQPHFKASNFKSSTKTFSVFFFSSLLQLQTRHNLSLYTMESLSDTQWDVVISGTGLHQSLLAL